MPPLLLTASLLLAVAASSPEVQAPRPVDPVPEAFSAFVASAPSFNEAAVNLANAKRQNQVNHIALQYGVSIGMAPYFRVPAAEVRGHHGGGANNGQNSGYGYPYGHGENQAYGQNNAYGYGHVLNNAYGYGHGQNNAYGYGHGQNNANVYGHGQNNINGQKNVYGYDHGQNNADVYGHGQNNVNGQNNVYGYDHGQNNAYGYGHGHDQNNANVYGQGQINVNRQNNVYGYGHGQNNANSYGHSQSNANGHGLGQNNGYGYDLGQNNGYGYGHGQNNAYDHGIKAGYAGYRQNPILATFGDNSGYGHTAQYAAPLPTYAHHGQGQGQAQGLGHNQLVVASHKPVQLAGPSAADQVPGPTQADQQSGPTEADQPSGPTKFDQPARPIDPAPSAFSDLHAAAPSQNEEQVNRNNAERQHSVNRIAFSLGRSAGTGPYYGNAGTSVTGVYGTSAPGTSAAHTGYGRATGYGSAYRPLAQAHGLPQQPTFHSAGLLFQGAYPVSH